MEKLDKLERNVKQSSNFISKYSYDQLIKWGVDEKWAEYVNMFVLLILSIVAVYVVYFIVLNIFRFTLTILSRKGKRPFLGYLYKHRFAHFAALIAPVSLMSALIPVVFDDFKKFRKPLQTLLSIYAVFMVIWILIAIIRAIAESLRTSSKIAQRPIESYVQVIKIILYLFGIIIIFSQLTGKSPAAFFGILGAASAVLLLMFKDTIMGFVASIQVTTNDMVRIGDWIEMPNYNADGDVLDITLTTVKVQNWDKTITTVPTHALISSSFINWRGMQEYGGRRIKRSIIIKQSSIKYIVGNQIDKFLKIEGIADAIRKRQKEIEEHNKKLHVNKELAINGRNLTNAGIFRMYAQWYVEHHPGVHQDRTVMVRQLAPTEHGIPFELYLFANDITWVEYEFTMADIFDHLIAAVPYFNLEIFEKVSGGDFKPPLDLGTSEDWGPEDEEEEEKEKKPE